MNRLFLLTLCLLTGVQATAQNRTIRGRVVDDGTGKPLVGVSIYVHKTERGVQSGTNGKFAFLAPKDAVTLQASTLPI